MFEFACLLLLSLNNRYYSHRDVLISITVHLQLTTKTTTRVGSNGTAMTTVGVNFQIFTVNGTTTGVDAVRAISLGVDIPICPVHGSSIFVGVNCIGTSTTSRDSAVGDVDSPISFNANGSIEVCERALAVVGRVASLDEGAVVCYPFPARDSSFLAYFALSACVDIWLCFAR